jgi:hypothetical protein
MSAIEPPSGIVNDNVNYRSGGNRLIYCLDQADITGADFNQTPYRINGDIRNQGGYEVRCFS